MSLRLSYATLLAGAAFILPITAASAQDAQQNPPAEEAPAAAAQGTETDTASQPVDDATGDEDEIVVVGQKARGSVVGDIPPEKTLNSGDIRATGATNIDELLEAIAPEIGSARGRGGERPVLLLNGQRISSFREMRDIPTEAIQRVEILPEEVALKYGYRADQRVVNIVLRPRFRSTVAQLAGGLATEGGYENGNADVTRLMIQRNGRTQFNLHAEGNSMLTEDERDILLSETPTVGTEDQVLAARSLVAQRGVVRGSATVNRSILGNVSATLNTEVEHDEGHSLIGLETGTLDALDRNTTSDSAHLGTTLNWDKADWHWNVTGNADWQRDLTKTDRNNVNFPNDRARETTTSGDITATANGTLFKLPAGNAGTTVRVGASTIHLDSESRRLGIETPNSLGRTAGTGSINIDLPISRRGRDFSALGNLTLNANAEINQLSDFGTLTTIGAGANFSPVDRLNFITSWTREEGPPTIQQLGDPILTTPDTRVFDFATGQTVLIKAIAGGNPDLLHDRRNVWKIGGNWQPFEKTDLRLRAEYVHSRIDDPIQNISGPTPALEAAFPDRFQRAPCMPQPCKGQLLAVDFRPINFDSASKNTVRVGFDFTKPLKSRRPSQAVIDQMRAQFGGGRGGARGEGARSPASPATEGANPPSETGSRGGGFGGRGGGRFGGGNRGRFQFSLTDTITLKDQVSIAPGIPDLDYLHGEPAGPLGGTPRHQVQAQAGWYNNGFGARVGANWRSGSTADNLRFSPLATFDLRLFANLGEQFELVQKHPWMRGSQVRLEATNLFDAKPKVRDAAGETPLNYQPDLLEPFGRTIMISFRKLFLPPPSFFRQQRQQEQQQSAPATR